MAIVTQSDNSGNSGSTGGLVMDSPEVVGGFWSDPKSKVSIKEAYYGEKVKFTIGTKNIPDGTKLELKLKDYDPVNSDDFLSKYTVFVNGNIAEIEFITDEKWSDSAKYEKDQVVETYFEIKVDIDGDIIVNEFPENKDDYLILYKTPEIVTVLIELPHAKYTDKLNRKGLAGHTAIMIGDEFYDFGPQPSEPYYSEGRPWWDIMSASGNLKRNDIIAILESPESRKKWRILGEVYLIDLEIAPKEKEKLEQWWIKKYQMPGVYSVIPIFGEQCTSNVRISLERNTSVFEFLSLKVQSPEGFYELLTNSARNSYGKNKGKQPIIKKKYNLIKAVMIMSLVFSFWGCVSNEAKKAKYIYNSEEYHLKVKGFSVSLDDAIRIASEFFYINNPTIEIFDAELSMVYDDYYIFSINPACYNLKTGKYNLSGIWVNGNSGLVIQKQTDKYVNVILMPESNSTYWVSDKRIVEKKINKQE